MTDIASLFLVVAYLFAGASAGFLALIRRKRYTFYLGAALLLLLLHTTLLEFGLYDVPPTVAGDSFGILKGLVETFTSLVLAFRFLLSLSSAVFFSLAVFSLALEKPKAKERPRYYRWGPQ